MFFKINHQIRYDYSGQVFIEPMTVRLRPRSDCWQKLHQFDMKIDPSPQGVSHSVDLDGNSTTCLWMSGTCDRLTLKTHSIVETLLNNPFGYVITEDNILKLPLRYSPLLENSLSPYLEREYTAEEVDIFSQDLLKKVGSHTVNFLNALNLRIFHEFKKEKRHEGSPVNPVETMSTGSGSCRDLAVLFMDCCRSVGLATRFTSGFFDGEMDHAERELHAWAEVYLPGAGWRGYDPTHGLAVADRHISLASGSRPQLAAPTFGMFRGTGISSTLDYTVSIQRAPSLEALRSPTHDTISPVDPGKEL